MLGGFGERHTTVKRGGLSAVRFGRVVIDALLNYENCVNPRGPDVNGEQLPAILNGLTEAVFLVDRSRQILFANRVAEQLFGKGLGWAQLRARSATSELS